MQKQVEQWCCRWAPSLGELEDTHENVWGTKPYDPETDIDKPCVFFGLYGFPDFIALWKHKGRKAILWAGSDIRHFVNGYWLDTTGEIRIADVRCLARWIQKYCENYVENIVEYKALKELGIESKIVPSFLGNIDDYEVGYEWSERPRLYTSVSGDNFKLYGWDKILEIAQQNPEVEFHLYGNRMKYFCMDSNWQELSNVFNHGRVPKEQMNAETKKMQGALRLTEFDGFSEIVAKSFLWGQYPVSLIPYKYSLRPDEIYLLRTWKEPNLEGRDYFRRILNNYPWNAKKH